jgi:hypothetical protein
VVVRFLLAALLVAAGPVVHLTKADTRVAQTSLVKLADFGTGWSGKASTTQSGVALQCPGDIPSGKGIRVTGAADSQNFSLAKTGPFASQATSVYANTGEAKTYWQRAVTKALLGCVVKNVETLASQGVKVSITSQKLSAFKSPAQRSAVYRIVAKANALKLYFDVIVLGSGRSISTIIVSRFQAPLPASFEKGLAEIVSARMSTGSA